MSSVVVFQLHVGASVISFRVVDQLCPVEAAINLVASREVLGAVLEERASNFVMLLEPLRWKIRCGIIVGASQARSIQPRRQLSAEGWKARPLQKESGNLMSRFWRLASGLAVLLMGLFFSASLVMNLFIGERPLPGFAYRVLLPVLAFVVLFLAFAAAYFLLNDARNSK